MALLPPNNAGGSGVSDHGDLTGRDQPNSHPITAISGLSDILAGYDTALETARAQRFAYIFSNATTQDIIMVPPLDTLSLALIMVRTSDGALIEPEVTYLYGPGPMRYIERIRLGFTPAISGEHFVHIVR
jgi:hypothetical protein